MFNKEIEQSIISKLTELRYVAQMFIIDDEQTYGTDFKLKNFFTEEERCKISKKMMKLIDEL